jgi:hypothetical protein
MKQGRWDRRRPHKTAPGAAITLRRPDRQSRQQASFWRVI